MRTDKELYKILLDNIDKLEHGLCKLCYVLESTGVMDNDESNRTAENIAALRKGLLLKLLFFPKKEFGCWFFPWGSKPERIKLLKALIFIESLKFWKCFKR